MSIFNSSIITCEQCIPHVTRAQHASNMQNFLRHNTSHAFVNLDVSDTIVTDNELILTWYFQHEQLKDSLRIDQCCR